MKSVFLAAVFAMGTIASVQAATITNGSFEDPGTVTGGFAEVAPGSSAITGWTVEGGGVDLIRNFWEAQDGDFSLDLNRRSPGGISQTVTDLIVGQSYEVSFYLGANPGNRVGTRIGVIASIGDGFDAFSLVRQDTGRRDAGWTYQTLRFTAQNTSELLRFTAINPRGASGPALDNVQIAPVPLPAGGLLLLGGLAGLAMARKRRAQG